MMSFRAGSEGKQWGEFANAKINARRVLARDILKKPKGVTWLSAVTDPYQPIEKKYQLTRSCLQVLSSHGFPIWVQTKSSLVTRDIDLLSGFAEKDVGFTILTLDDDLRKRIEPGASPIDERLAALSELSSKGIQTFAFVGPILPFLSDSKETLKPLINELLKSGVKKILFDRLNLRWGVWPSIKNFLEKQYPSLLPKYRKVMWGGTDYFSELKKSINGLCKEAKLSNYEVCY
jgi:DNA repair photolyase